MLSAGALPLPLLLLLLAVGEGSHRLGGGLRPHDHAAGDFGPDHEAFLGPEQAKAFEQLPPGESQRRLGLLLEVVDADGSGGVSLGELRAWIQRSQRRARAESLREGLRRHDRDRDGAVRWEEYREESYGRRGDDFRHTQDPEAYRRLLARDQRRFRAADRDGDGAALPPEFAAFLHPEDYPHMRAVVVQETMEDMDRDGDGFVQEDEYIAELYSAPPGQAEPPWVEQERAQFRRGRDLDGDGRLSPAEVEHWLQPPSEDWAGLEAAHLLHHADSDRDGQLTRAEALAQWQMFVGSQATNYGQDLERPHDEL